MSPRKTQRQAWQEGLEARMMRAAEQKRQLPAMTEEQRKEYESLKLHGLAFMRHLGALFELLRTPPDDYQI